MAEFKGVNVSKLGSAHALAKIFQSPITFVSAPLCIRMAGLRRNRGRSPGECASRRRQFLFAGARAAFPSGFRRVAGTQAADPAHANDGEGRQPQDGVAAARSAAEQHELAVAVGEEGLAPRRRSGRRRSVRTRSGEDRRPGRPRNRRSTRSGRPGSGPGGTGCGRGPPDADRPGGRPGRPPPRPEHSTAARATADGLQPPITSAGSGLTRQAPAPAFRAGAGGDAAAAGPTARARRRAPSGSGPGRSAAPRGSSRRAPARRADPATRAARPARHRGRSPPCGSMATWEVVWRWAG